MPLSQLESRLHYEFRDPELLRRAVTHRSHSAANNERLEFLGDSILNCAVAAMLFKRFGALDEGDLSRVRANLVKQQSLYEISQALGISEFLFLGEGELKSGGFRRPSILADTLEAIFGAIYLDGGFDAAHGVIGKLYAPVLDHIDPNTLGKDAKTLLQEYLQGHQLPLPQYSVVATHGAAHNQQFEVECTVPKLDIKVSGSGASRRAAEQAAAKLALDEASARVPSLTPARRAKGVRTPRAAMATAKRATAVGEQQALDLRIKADSKAAGGADLRAHSKGDSKADSRADARADSKTDPKPDVKTDAKLEPKADLKADLKADSKVNSKADPKADSKGDAKADKPEPKTEEGADARPESRSEARPVLRTRRTEN